MNNFIEIDSNYREINSKLMELAGNAKNIKPMLKSCALIMKNYVDQNFETEGQNAGEKWESWTDEYKAHREKIGRGNGRILTLEGELRASIESAIIGEAVYVGTNKEYAAIHNFGGDIKKRRRSGRSSNTTRTNGNAGGSFTMKARPFAVWTDDLIELIEKEAERKLLPYQ